jgi:aryl-alcohol dehydrogenase-like predicted oxidoreductase
MAEALGLGAALWSPLGGGLLTGKYRKSPEGRAAAVGILIHRESTAHATAVLDALLAVAEATGSTPSSVAIAWLRARAASATTALIPILGPRTLPQLNDALEALNLGLASGQIDQLEVASRIDLGVPHEMVGSERYLVKLIGGRLEVFHPPVIPVA